MYNIEFQAVSVNMTFASTALAQIGVGVYVVPVNSSAFNVTIYARPMPPLTISQLNVTIALGVVNSTGSYILLNLGTATISNPSGSAYTYVFSGNYSQYNAVFYQVTAATNQGTYTLPGNGEWFATQLSLPAAQVPPTFAQYMALLAMAPVLALAVRMGLRAQALGLVAYAAVIMPLFALAGVTSLRAVSLASIAFAIAILNFLAARKIEG